MRTFTNHGFLWMWISVLQGLCTAGQVSLVGKVTTADGAPIHGIGVTVGTSTGYLETKTDVEGNYSLSVEEGTHQELRIRCGSAASVDRIEGIPRTLEHVAASPLVVSGNTVKDVRLPRYFSVQGTLRSPTGKPVAKAEVGLAVWTGGMAQLPSDEVLTDSSGGFRLYGPAGAVLVNVHGIPDSGLATFQRTFTLSADTTLSLEYPVAPLLTGIVRTSDNIPLAGVLVAVAMDLRQQEIRTDSLGRFRFHMAKGTVSELRIRAMSDTLSRIPSNLEHRARENFPIERDTNLDITLPPFPLLQGVLTGMDGSPIAKAEVSIHGYTGSMRELPWDGAVSDSSGKFSVRGRKGLNQLSIVPPGGSRFGKLEIPLELASDTSSKFVLKPASILRGRVTLHQGSPVRGIAVALSDGMEQKETRTDSNGRFQILTAAGRYPDFRVRNMGTNLDGVPKNLEWTAVLGGITLADSLDLDLALPPFHRITGKVVDPKDAGVDRVELTTQWIHQGMNSLPSDGTLSTADGSFVLHVPGGVNLLVIRPPLGSGLSAGSFTLKVDSSLVRNILVADQTKGISRAQPSVVGQGLGGRLVLTGTNTRFTDGVTSVDFGQGIQTTAVKILSDISLAVEILVDPVAAVGNRSPKVVGAKETYLGAELLTITAPSGSRLSLDGQGKLRQAVTIEDATGTQLRVDSGTTVRIPTGALDSLAFEAPVVRNDSVQPDSGKFISVQRVFHPSGVQFDPPASLTYHYKDQDVVGIDEAKLVAFKYDDNADTIVGEYKITKRDTTHNLITQEVRTFSLFRLAERKGQMTSLKPGTNMPRAWEIRRLPSRTSGTPGEFLLDLELRGATPGSVTSLKLVDLSGRELWTSRWVAGTNAPERIQVRVGRAGLQPGILFLKAQNGDLRPKTLRILYSR